MRAALLRRRRAGGGFGYLAANGFTPSLVADFVRGRYAYAVPHAGGYRPQRCDFDDLFTFARSSTATYVDATGILQTAAADTPRQNHHVYEGGQWVNKGLLIESESRTNLCPYSESRSQWVESGLTGAATAELGNGVGGVSFTPTAGAESYRIYDATNAAWITALTSYDEAADSVPRRQHVTFTTPAGCTSVRIYMSRDTAETAYVYDAISGLTASTAYTASWFYDKPSSALRVGGLQLE